MKKITTFSLCLFTILFFSNLSAQIDTTRSNEFRFSILGVQQYNINIPGYLEDFNSRYADLTFAYLRKLKNQKRLYLKTEISGLRLTVVDFDQRTEEKIADGRLAFVNVFIGLERQTQFRYFGLFLSGGITGGFARYVSDFKPPELPPIQDYHNTFRSVGVAGQATAYTNISSNIYIYATVTVIIQYEDVEYNKVIDKCCENNSYFDYKLLYVDAIGVAYKF